MWRDWFVCSDVSSAFKACLINEVMSYHSIARCGVVWCGVV